MSMGDMGLPDSFEEMDFEDQLVLVGKCLVGELTKMLNEFDITGAVKTVKILASMCHSIDEVGSVVGVRDEREKMVLIGKGLLVFLTGAMEDEMFTAVAEQLEQQERRDGV